MTFRSLRQAARLAFEETYQRAYDEKAPLASILSGLTGWQYKYRHRIMEDSISRRWDKNLYNWVEQILFGFPRLVKNTLKLGTEFLWLLPDKGLIRKSDPDFNAETALTFENNPPTRSSKMLKAIYPAFASICWFIATLGKTLSSPLTAQRLLGIATLRSTGSEFLASCASLTLGLATLAAYTALASIAAPLLGLSPLLAFATASLTAMAWYIKSTLRTSFERTTLDRPSFKENPHYVGLSQQPSTSPQQTLQSTEVITNLLTEHQRHPSKGSPSSDEEEKQVTQSPLKKQKLTKTNPALNEDAFAHFQLTPKRYRH